MEFAATEAKGTFVARKVNFVAAKLPPVFAAGKVKLSLKTEHFRLQSQIWRCKAHIPGCNHKCCVAKCTFPAAIANLALQSAHSRLQSQTGAAKCTYPAAITDFVQQSAHFWLQSQISRCKVHISGCNHKFGTTKRTFPAAITDLALQSAHFRHTCTLQRQHVC